MMIRLLTVDYSLISKYMGRNACRDKTLVHHGMSILYLLFA